MEGSERSSIEELHRRFVQLAHEGFVNRKALVLEILFHPASMAKMRSAVSLVLKQKAIRRDLTADVVQESVILLIERFREGRIDYEDAGCDEFAG